MDLSPSNRVVHVVRQFSPSIGGLESAVLNLARAQRQHFGIEASVVTLNRVFGERGLLPARAEVSGVPVHRMPWRGSTRYPLAPSVLSQLFGSDIVHVHGIDFFFDFLAATAPFHRRTLIASTHGGFFHSKKYNRIKKFWFQNITGRSVSAYKYIAASSPADATLFEPIVGGRLGVVENGIDQTRLADAASRSATRTIICFGRFAAHKRIGELFKLLAGLRQQDARWQLIVAGRDSDQTSAELWAFAGQAGVADAVRIEVNPDDAQLRKLIGEASFYASASEYEGFGLAAVEAMSAGLFPLLSGIAPFRRLVTETGRGLIVDPMTTAPHISELDIDEGANVLRRAALIASVRRYDWTSVADQFNRIYAQALRSGQVPSVGGLHSA